MRHILYRLGVWLISHEYVKYQVVSPEDEARAQVLHSLKRQIQEQYWEISRLKIALSVLKVRGW